MICLLNNDTDETITITIDQFTEMFNNDTNGNLSSVYTIVWTQYEHPHAIGS
jgi:hypothetical protein